MNTLAKLILAFIGFFWIGGAIGCSKIIEPDYAGDKSKANSELRLGMFDRGLFLGADMEFVGEGIEYQGKGGSNFNAKTMTMTQKPQNVMSQGWVPVMQEGTNQIRAKGEFWNENARIWSPVLQNLIDKGFGVFGRAVDGHYTVAQQKVMFKQTVAEGVTAILTGSFPRSELSHSVQPDVAAEIDKQLRARVAELAAELKLTPALSPPPVPEKSAAAKLPPLELLDPPPVKVTRAVDRAPLYLCTNTQRL